MTGRRYLLLLGAIVGLALLLRFARISADIPSKFEGTAAAQLDAFWYVEKAAAAADGTTYERVTEEPPLWNACARCWFAVVGTGVGRLNALGAFFSLASILGVVALATRGFGRTGGLVAGGVLAVCHTFLVLDRTPLIYGPIATFLVLSAFLWLEGLGASGKRRIALCAASLLVLGASGFFFKGASFLLFPALVASAVVGSGERTRRALAIGAALVLLVALAIVIADPRGIVASYRWKLRAVTFDPGDDGLVLGYVRRLLVVGGERAYFAARRNSTIAPFLGSAAFLTSPLVFALATAGVFMAWRDRHRVTEEAGRTLVLLATWTLGFLVIAAALDYRPLRYAALIAPPTAVLAAYALARLGGAIELRPAPVRPPARGLLADLRDRPADALVVFVIAWFGAAHALGLARDLLVAPASAEARAGADRAIVVVSAFVAFLAAALVKPASGVRAVRIPALALALGGALLAIDLARDLRVVFGERTTLARANAIVRGILGPKAVLAGPYSVPLAIGSPIERRVAKAAFDSPDIAVIASRMAASGYTHVALDLEQEKVSRLTQRLAAIHQPPSVVGAVDVRGYRILILRLFDAERRGYVPSRFEALEDARRPAEEYRDFDAGAQAARARAYVWLGLRNEARSALACAPEDDEDVRALRVELR